ncbi:hypothetical protein V5799_008743 [Amblyomma americanum]|uniref:Uncharacterized protein n=1 Tax=Amblyomma americanum TaxID=6943 RepID=A0AAQ4FDG7_AMBAM
MSDSTRSSDLCNVYLCSTPIQQPGSRALSFFASSSRSVTGHSWEKHWLVAFDYGGPQVFVCDADMDHAGDLTGRSTWKSRKVLEEVYPYKRHLGEHRIPQARIETVVKKMSASGSYHLTKNNCQKWAERFLRELGIQITLCEPQAEEVVERVIIPGAVGGALLAGAAIIFVKRHSLWTGHVKMSDCTRSSDLCNVYLCSTPIQQPGSRALSFFASSSRSVTGHSWEKNWLVAFDYGGPQVFVCDADMDHAGDLTGRSTWKSRKVLEEVYPYKRWGSTSTTTSLLLVTGFNKRTERYRVHQPTLRRYNKDRFLNCNSLYCGITARNLL